MEEMPPYENPLSIQRFTAKSACLAAGMRYSDLNYWNRAGLMQRLSPARREGRWRKYNFSDVVVLATAQQLINLGLPARSAVNWALEAHHQLRQYDYSGSLVIWSEKDEQRAAFTPDVTMQITNLPPNATVVIAVKVGTIASMARRRLIAAGAIPADWEGARGLVTEGDAGDDVTPVVPS
jgi:hypothetical protein